MPYQILCINWFFYKDSGIYPIVEFAIWSIMNPLVKFGDSVGKKRDSSGVRPAFESTLPCDLEQVTHAHLVSVSSSVK